MKKWTSPSILFYIVFFLINSNSLFCQSKIHVIESNKLEQIKINDTIFQKFCGDVMIEYSDLKIQCDTITINKHNDDVRAWGNVSFFNDTLKCLSDSIKINERLNTIIFYKNSQLSTNNISIFGDFIQYDFKQKIIKYWKKGIVENMYYNISSEEFIYHLKKEESIFSQNIKLISDSLTMYTENMINKDSLVVFFGPTSINYENILIECQKGNLRNSNDFEILEGLTIISDSTTIKANYLKKDKNISYFKDEISIKSDNNISIFGDRLVQENEISTVTQNSYVELLNNNDSTNIRGDTIIIDDNKKYAEINNNVKILGNELYGKCKKLTFDSNYTKMKMINEPALWFKDIQLTGDEIEIYFLNNNIDSMFIAENPFIIAPEDTTSLYHQIKGKILEGSFIQNQIKFFELKGNGMMKYFENNNESIGVNNVNAGKIKLLFNENLLENILCNQEIESNYYEIEKDESNSYNSNQMYLNGFKLRNK